MVRYGFAAGQQDEPGEEKTYEQMAQIKAEIAESLARNEITSLRDKIEDERAPAQPRRDC